MTRTRVVATGAVLAVAGTAAVLAGCSGGGSGPSPSTPPHTSAHAPSGRTGSATPADAATRAAVQAAYTALFGTKATTAQSLAAVQHGSAFRQVVIAESRTSRAHGSGAKVTAVSLQGPDLATVHFTVISNGTPVLPTTGKAVRIGGHWRVAAVTFCQLLVLNGDAPTQCSDPAFTALPH